MADTGRIDPFENMISLVAGPIAAVLRSVEQLRKGADEVMRGLENFNATMENLNETAARVNRLLNDFEEPIRAMLPQMTRTVKLAEEVSTRLAGPVDRVAPGLARLADTLNSPVLTTMPRDLGHFMEIINDLGRRMSPLAQLAESTGGMFGMRLPGFPSRPAAPAPAASPAVVSRSPEPEPAAPAAAPRPAPAKKAPARRAPARKSAAKKTTARKTTARKTTARKTTTRKKAAAKKSAR